MAWITPSTRSTNELITAIDWNADVVANLIALKTPPTDVYNPAGGYSTTSTSYVDVDATNYNLTITTTGGDILIIFSGSGAMTASSNVGYVTVALDGTDLHTAGIAWTSAATYGDLSFTLLLEGIAAGSHSVKLRYKVSASTLTLLSGGHLAIREV
ncbi:MAG: hypothetical protein WC657_06900 [Candidatus Paceibacterota bacterium]|jgi:hypothetical protein